jgi:hypothetical protein
MEDTIGIKSAFGNQSVEVWMKVGAHIPPGLNRDHCPWDSNCREAFTEELFYRFPCTQAQFSYKTSVVLEVGANNFWNGKYLLLMSDIFQNLIRQPFRKLQDPLHMA